MNAPAFIPLLFRPGEAYQFDWSHEDVEISGKPMRVKVAHVRLCASRAMYVRAYPRETQEMLFDAHARAFAFFGGVPTRGIYDNMKTAVTSVFTGKERVFNRRFLVMANHYMVEPTACSPASGWEKGQVENQVQTARGRFFQPRLRFTSLEELNGWLEAECRRWAELHQHPEQKELTVAQAWAAERSVLRLLSHPSTAFMRASMRKRHMPHQLRPQSLLRFCQGGATCRSGPRLCRPHRRALRRGSRRRPSPVFRPGPDHLRPVALSAVLATKPGALRNGAPFQGWELPPALARLRRKLGVGDDADRRFVRVLAAVLDDGLEAVEAAVREALLAGVASDDVIVNILARRREPPRTADYCHARRPGAAPSAPRRLQPL